MEGLDLGRNESHAEIRAKKCRIDWKALPSLSFRKAIKMRFSIRTSADLAEVPESETTLYVLLSQASNSFSDSLQSAVSLTSFGRYSVLQKHGSVQV